jgi:hypothetical protein
MRRTIAALVAAMALVSGAGMATAAFADAGGGPGSNSGCPGHQPPPSPHGGCGK